MPIIDIELVGESETEFAKASAQTLADAIGRVLGGEFGLEPGSEPGHIWVRLRFLNRLYYAESLSTLDRAELPTFVTVLQAHPPAGDALAAEVIAITMAVAQCLARAPERVHVQYAPPAAGRQAFGGKLVV